MDPFLDGNLESFDEKGHASHRRQADRLVCLWSQPTMALR